METPIARPMPRTRAGLALTLLALFPGLLPADEGGGTTPDGFLRRGTPTFVVGTAGDDHSDREIRSQVKLIRGLLFPGFTVVADDSVEISRGPEAWPPNPILYGGPHANAVLAKLAPSLPFRLDPGTLTLGDRTFRGDAYRLIAVVPARRRMADRFTDPPPEPPPPPGLRHPGTRPAARRPRAAARPPRHTAR